MKSRLPESSIVLLAALIASAGCNAVSDETPRPDAGPRIAITTAPVTRADIVDTTSIFGTVSLRQQASLGSQFDGRLSDFTLLPGDRVRKGQQIGTIIPPAREALLQVINEMPAAVRPNLERQIHAIPLVSSMDGVVLEVWRHTGDVVQKGEQIVHIGDLRELDIRGDLPVRHLPTIRKAATITVDFVDYPHAPLSLPLQAIAGRVNENNQTVMIRLKLENPAGEFRPGMLVKLSFVDRGHPGALVIPRAALLEEEGVYYVFVLKENKVERREVTPGILQDSRVEILRGVEENEVVAIEKAYSLQDGMEVQVK